MTNRDKGPDTQLVHAGRRKEWHGRLINTPVHRGSTILFDSVEQMRKARPGHGCYNYGLQGTPTEWTLAEALTELELGAAGTALLPSGLAAVTAALTTVLAAGDELLVVDSVYGPTRHFCDEILVRQGVTTRYYDPLASTDELETLVGSSTKAIFLESPGSQTFEVQDVPGICAMASRRGIVTLLDNTWATPLLFPAMAAGVNLSILALTKYVGGHSDLLLGSVTADEEWWPRLQRTVFGLGHSVSPDDAWLASRGLRTMGIRLRRHESSALQIAKWLASHPRVDRVLHPAFESCGGHEFWTRDFRGAAGLFAFTLRNGTAASATALVDALELFGIGYSWGGYESLAIPVYPTRTAVPASAPPGTIIRLQIGLENPEDLIDDLEQALGAG